MTLKTIHPRVLFQLSESAVYERLKCCKIIFFSGCSPIPPAFVPVAVVTFRPNVFSASTYPEIRYLSNVSNS
uniref:Uncharacterized protein n=1 Tax=Utricularia reniformis TaxID=192314 RepID=A0A1Y0AZN7_9LAMI|nr:hypothetical protein AEK19_MT0374 [Utricularia reniformis]ART30646.1 hypothetical protein AEK19_MT0374 [Utricularia reniformis]